MVVIGFQRSMHDEVADAEPSEGREPPWPSLACGAMVTHNIRLSRKLGDGGMGSVWLADHLGLGNQVVIKFMSPELARDEQWTARFRREAELAARVRHPPPVCTPIAAKLVTIGAFSIDATEVTNHQYQAFLAAKGGDTSGQPAACAFNTTFVPAAGWPAAEDQCNHPVVNVDWCDAYAYCKWAGKRLCGSPSGGRASYSDFDSTTSSQWFAACSRAAGSRFIYGASYLPKVCVDDQYDGKAGVAMTDTRMPVTSATGCRGAAAPYDALFDLNGNVMEWEDSCNDQKDGEDDCRTRGGSFREARDKCDCEEGKSHKRKQYADDLGFRCCGL